MPRTECLADVIARFLPYWESGIVPDLRTGATVLVAAHGNSLRALVKHLDGISDEDIAGLNIPTGMPLALRARRLAGPRHPRRPLPRPGGRRRSRGCRREPGSVGGRSPRIPGDSVACGRNFCTESGTSHPDLGAERQGRLISGDRRHAYELADSADGFSPVTTKTTRLATETAWSAIRS